MADLKQMLLTMHPNTKALAKAFANNILAGFAGEGEEVDAANPWGCNQYGHRNGHKGGESKKKESDDVYDFDNMEPDERLQQAIDNLGEVEEEDINWDDFDKAQEVKKIFHPDNHKVAQWRKERMINEVGNRVADALRHLANVNKASRDFRNPNRPTEDDVARAEEAFGKAVHEWRRFHRARLEVQGWDKKAIDGYLSRWTEYMETANADEVDAANPYGCNGSQHKCPQKGTMREHKVKKVNSTPKICGPDATQGEKEKALKEGIEWVLKNRKSLYGVCYVKSVNKNGKEELLPLDLHLEDILHANEHNDMADELWKTISRGEWVIRDSDTDEVYRIGRKKVVLRDYMKNRDMGKRKKIVTHYKDNRDDKKRE